MLRVFSLRRPDSPRTLATFFAAFVSTATLLASSFASPGRCDDKKNASIETIPARIDRLILDGGLGLVAPKSSDAEFLRRVSLDLTGMIPTAADVRAFQSDASPGKRAALVDRLLDSPHYLRHMTDVLDVMLMERRADKGITSADWRAYLYDSLVENKPLNLLAREILAADDGDPRLKPTAKFYLDRQVEPNLLTRDVGRVFFGKDFQCAQCHDHPLIEDYSQADYYGIYAFLNRSYLFADKKDKTKTALAEKADGDVNFSSVFTKKAGQTGPRLPGEGPSAEPTIKKGEEYVAATAADGRQIPKYSRRARLAELATDGSSRAFNRNMANRLWALMMGRGIVEPVDLHHSDNPPSHPELLEYLTDQLVAMKFDMRSYLRALSASETYQRSYALPIDFAAAAKTSLERISPLEAEQATAKKAAEAARTAADEFLKTVEVAEKAAVPAQESAAKATAAVAAAQAAVDKATKPLDEAKKKVVARQEVAAVVTAAAAKAQEAVAKLDGDKDLAAAAQKFQDRAKKLETEIAALAKAAEALTKPVETAQAALVAAQKAAEPSEKALAEARQKIDVLRRQWIERNNSAQAANQRARHLETRLEELELLQQWKLEKEKPVDQQAGLDSLEADLVQRTAHRFLASNLRPLQPEQLAWSMLQAVGLVEATRVASENEFDKKAQAAGAKTVDVKATDAKTATPAVDPKVAAKTETKPAAPAAAQPAAPATPPRAPPVPRPRAIEQAMYPKLAGNAKAFVALFGGGDGQPQNEFYATVDQALFFANGATIRGWLTPSGGNLTARLIKLDDPRLLAEELYASVLSRSPTPVETDDVAAYLADRKDEKAAAVQELAWGLLTCSEFRFNH